MGAWVKMYREVISANYINPIKKEIPDDKNNMGADIPDPELITSMTF